MTEPVAQNPNRSTALHIVLYQPEIPQNTGNIARTCVAVGAKLWLVRPLGFRLDEKRLQRAGLDYWQHLDYEVVDSWPALRSRLDELRPWYFSKRAVQLYTDVCYRPGDALVFGAERTGLPASWLENEPARAVRIPIRPQVRSLNLANSVAIAAYETLRQWHANGVLPYPS